MNALGCVMERVVARRATNGKEVYPQAIGVTNGHPGDDQALGWVPL
jgi:hypothetical protein